MLKLINEWAFKLDLLIPKVARLNETVTEHIIRCVVYKNTTGDLKHWVYDELGDYFETVSHYDARTVRTKLKLSKYKELLFDNNGNNTNDTKGLLKDFRNNFVEKQHRYPDFEITEELVELFYKVRCEIRDTVCPIFTLKEHYYSKFFGDIVTRILNKYGIK